MASAEQSRIYEYHLQIDGCKEIGTCVLAGTDSCPMNQEIIVVSGLAPKRIPRNTRVDTADVEPFYNAVTAVGLIRRISRHPKEGSLAQDMASGRESDELTCDKVGGKRGGVYTRRL